MQAQVRPSLVICHLLFVSYNIQNQIKGTTRKRAACGQKTRNRSVTVFSASLIHAMPQCTTSSFRHPDARAHRECTRHSRLCRRLQGAKAATRGDGSGNNASAPAVSSSGQGAAVWPPLPANDSDETRSPKRLDEA